MGQDKTQNKVQSKFYYKLKFIIPVTIVILYFVIGGPLIGLLAEKVMIGLKDSFINKVPNLVENDFSYKRGWYTTEGKGQFAYKWDLTDAKGNVVEHNTLNLNLGISINHVFFNSSFYLEIGPEDHKKYFGQYKSAPRIEFNAYPNLKGNLEVQFLFADLALVEGASSDQYTMELFGGHGVVELNNSSGFESLSLLANEIVLKQGLKVNVVKSPGLLVNSNWGGETYSGGIEIYFDHWENLATKAGPGILELELENLDANALVRVKDMLTPAANAGKSKDAQIKSMLGLMEVANDLFKHSPKINMTHFKIRTVKGDLSGTGGIELKQGPAGFSMYSLLNDIYIYLKLQAPKVVAESLAAAIYMGNKIQSQVTQNPNFMKTPEGQKTLGEAAERAKGLGTGLLKDWSSRGYIHETAKGDFSVDLKFAKGNLNLNGRLISLQQLLQGKM